MAWDVEYTNVFGQWWDELSLDEQASVSRVVGLLELNGPSLIRPYADTLKSSRITNLKELRYSMKAGHSASCMPLTLAE